MENLFYSIGWVFAIGFLVFFSQIYFWRRKLDQMADDDVKRTDPEEWKRHMKFTRYTKLISRLFWGGFFVVWAVRYFAAMQSEGSVVFITSATLIGVSFIVWAIYGFSAHGKVIEDLR
jgi:hypothetical protein